MKLPTLILILLLTMSCKGQIEEKHKHTNELSKETSPYLLQHAHNPVNWHAWNDKTLALAKDENKLILISIGYAACHWCHVMEQESFENEAVAKIMNDNFICIKVDREERPDVDQVYMDAVQLLNGNGGWPLNAVALPNGEPFWGGTYFPKENWMSILTQIANMWQEAPAKIETYAAELTEGIRSQNQIITKTSIAAKVISTAQLNNINNKWEAYFDKHLGGYNRAPKFPMPNNYHYLLRYAVQSEDADLLQFVNTTLTKMAHGGIYDQIGGGFARYSTDVKWHIPHFEKMLYDNGQLVSLYADAYLVTKNLLYKETVYQTLDFVARELTAENGGFYASLDADSLNNIGENKEGAYYVWSLSELKQILKGDFTLFQSYYNCNSYGHWENNHYVLIRNETDSVFCKNNKLSLEQLKNNKNKWHKLLLEARNKRKRPGLDDKTLTSWNALMLKGYIDAYRVFDDVDFLEIALKNADFLMTNMLREEGGVNRNFKNNKSNINAYLEDYAILIDAFIALYEVSLEEKYLVKAQQLTDFVLLHFYDTKSGYFFFTSDQDPALVTRKIDLVDNVIPSGNSIMARSLFKLGHYYANNNYSGISKKMLYAVLDKAMQYPPSYSNWLQLAADMSSDYYEIAVSGPMALARIKDINQVYIPNKLIVGSAIASDLPLLQNRFDSLQTNIYICVNKSCKLPTDSVVTALEQIKTTFK